MERNGFFFQKVSKRQIQQGLFEYNIYRQKNKKSSKDKAANTISLQVSADSNLFEVCRA